MKKFFGKLPVMITFVALAVIFAVVYIGMLVRPVAIGMSYKGTIPNPENPTETMEVSVKFKSGKKAVMSYEDEDETIYYFEKDGYVVFLPIDDVKDYDDAKEAALNNWATTKEYVAFGMGGTDCNAFGAKVLGAELECTGSVVFAIVGGVIELVLLAGAGLAVFYTIKKK